MKRSRIKPTISDFELEFREMRSFVRQRSGGFCEAGSFVCQHGSKFSERIAVMPPCDGRATNTHHRKYRSRGGTNALSNLIDLCGPCHSWIHAHGGFGGKANQLGLALSAGESEEL